jgi:hypothetical protein
MASHRACTGDRIGSFVFEYEPASMRATRPRACDIVSALELLITLNESLTGSTLGKIVRLLVRMISGEREQLLDIDATDFNKWKCSIGFRFVLKEK